MDYFTQVFSVLDFQHYKVPLGTFGKTIKDELKVLTGTC